MSNSGIGQEYTVCFDTTNRNVDTYPEPNNFSMPLLGDGQSTLPPVTQLHMGSIELPSCTQWIIEEPWSELRFDQGISTAINVTPAEDENQLFTVAITPTTGAATTTVVAAVPPTLNPVTIAVAGTTATVTSTFPHGLVAARATSANGVSWPRVTLEGTSLQDEATKDVSTNPTVTITGPNTFTMTQLAGAPAAGTGYLLSRDPNPEQLAAGLTAALNAELATAFVDNTPIALLTYNKLTNLFTLSMNNGRRDMLVTLTHAAVSLPTKMGFGQNAILTLNNSLNDPFTTNFTVTGNYSASTCPSTLSLQPGNYTPETFIAEFERAWNPFVFNGGCGAVLADREVFAFTNAAGACFQIPIDYGTYTPDSFATFLQNAMNVADPSQTYTVTYNAADQTLTISSDMPFGMPLDDPVVTPLLVERMGFEPVCYNGALAYTSAPLGYIPGECSSVPQFRSGNLRVLWKESQCLFIIRFCGTPCQTDTIVVAAGQGTIGPLPLAHGLSVGDFVNLTSTTGAASTLPVVAVPDAFTFTVDMYNSAILNGDTVAVCDWASQNASLNLYFHAVPMLASVMGFPVSAVFSGSDGELIAPHAYNFDGPPYLLWVINDPQGSAFIKHTWKTSTKENIFAKLILRNNVYSIERLYPMQKIMQGNHKMTQLNMSIFNPDHTLFNFHGKNWSGTLTFVTASTAGALLAY
jgi:hypothetical protein